MLETLFAFESSRRQQQEAPLYKERYELLQAKSEKGTPAGTLRRLAAMLLQVVRFTEVEKMRLIDQSEIVRAGARWSEQTEYRNRNGQRNAPEYFIYVATMFFSFHGALRHINVRVEPHDSYLEQFEDHLLRVRGLAPVTVQSAKRRVGAFLRWTILQGLVVSALSMNDVDDYLRSKREQGCLPRSIASVCGALKLFFKFAERQEWTTTRIAMGIRHPRIPRSDRAPSGPEWADVRRMFEHDFGSAPGDIRGDAIVALSSIYALRNSEIIRLKVSDFDWLNEIVTVRRSKSHKVQQFPISIEAGEKIIRYLKHARPRCASRLLFVNLRRPYRQLDQATVWSVVALRLKALGIQSKHYGTHAIRHACATRLLHEGSSLPEIAKFLGHSDLKSVSIYAKHDTEALLQVASMSFAGVL